MKNNKNNNKNNKNKKTTNRGSSGRGSSGKSLSNRSPSNRNSSARKNTVNSEELLLRGTFIPNEKGFGFVELGDGERDLFIPPDMTGGAFLKDVVEVKIIKERTGSSRRREAQVVNIISRGVKTLVGTFEKKKGQGFGFVLPDNTKIPCDVYVPVEMAAKAKNGQQVLVELTDYGDGSRISPQGRVIEVLGRLGEPGVDVLSVIRDMKLPLEFEREVLSGASTVNVPVSEDDIRGRLDLRDTPMVTIDGEDSKDLDDAVSLRREGDSYVLGVHIADVSHYVKEGSVLDKCALDRGTSIYLADRVIPMLPKELSNGICSLNQGEDRLALSCIMTLDQEGEVTDYIIRESVINVDRRMTYTDVNLVITGDSEASDRYSGLKDMFLLMNELAGILRKKRHQKGSLDFDLPESKIILDDDGWPEKIMAYERNAATSLIEEFMLLANETVAKHFCMLEIPFLYRSHDAPDPDRMKQLALFIANFSLSLKTTGDSIHPREIQKLLEKIEDTPQESTISRLTLRSMKKACYTTDARGHFGLAFKYYTHFTSPIRRYPDLQIHRIIKEQLRGALTEKRTEHYNGILENVARHSSEMEIRSVEAEREVEKLKKSEYMFDRIGNIYEGVISGITSFGVYVELPDTVEGMIHISAFMDDDYYYDDDNYTLVGRYSGKKLNLGDSIRIQVQDVDIIARKIDFIPAPESQKKRRR